MLNPEQVPLEVIHELVMNLNKEWPEAIAAMINAWPGVQHDTEHEKHTSYIILPLPTEPSDD